MGQPRRIRRDSFRVENDLAPQSGVKVKVSALCEEERTKLIGEICAAICDGRVTDEMRERGLALIGKLARRRPNEPAHALGVDEAREAVIRGNEELTQTRRRR